MEADEALKTVQAICQVSCERARELVDAASGSVERAIDIHFGQAQPVHDEAELTKRKTDGNLSKPTKASSSSKVSSPADSPGSKRQATLNGFLGTTPVKTESKQRKLDSFFSPTKKKTSESASSEQGHEARAAQLELKPRAETRTEEALIEEGEPLDGESRMTPKNQKSDDNGENTGGPCLEYSLLTQTFATMCSTTKRTIKLQALSHLFSEILRALGGIHDTYDRQEDSRVLVCALDLVLGKLSTKQAGSNNAITLQVSGAALSTALQTVLGVSRSQLRQAYRTSGDLGNVAAQYFENKGPSLTEYFTKTKATPSSLTIVQVHDMLQAVATVPSGPGSLATRQNLLIKLLRNCQNKEEMRFLARIALGNMRLGATIKTVLAALATAVNEIHGQQATKGTSQRSSADNLQQIFYVCPRMDEISHALLVGGIPYAKETCSLRVGYPVHPMLANPAHSLEQVQSFMTLTSGQSLPAVAEYKLDGMRCQAHWDGTTTRLFSRHLLDNTEQYPDAVEYLSKARRSSVDSFIIDAEIVGVSPLEKGGFRLLPFQDLSTRAKLDTSGGSCSIQIRIYAFDLLYLNGKSLIDCPLWERQRALRQNFEETDGFAFVTSLRLQRYDETLIQNFLQEAIKGGAEGLMIKLTGECGNECSKEQDELTDRTYGYESGARSQLWLKLKRDYVAGYADTIDVVPIGAWYGNGRKAQKGFLSPVLLAVYDDDDGVFRSISRCMSFSDDMYEAMREFYFHGTPYPAGLGINESVEGKEDTEEPSDIKEEGDRFARETDGDDVIIEDDESGGERVNCFPGRPPSSVIVTKENPSIWFKPMEVFEVSFADLSLSRAHTAAAGLMNDPDGRGVALRFPRFKRRRPDKSVEEATTSEQIAQLYYQQSKMYINKT